MSNQPKLFQPIRVGNVDLKHRVVLAPLTRWRQDKEHVHHPIVFEYYSQRASVPGTLLITEATYIAPKAAGLEFGPGIWSEKQIASWRKITGEVHAKGSFIFLQLWALGRTAEPEVLEKESFPYISASDVQLDGTSKPPRPLTTQEVAEYVQLYAVAASNAVHKAGFDGVEIHGANGFLIDQFIQDVSNKRTDTYGGSPENRARFALEVVAAVTKAVGADKTAIRLSPWATFYGMGQAGSDPVANFSYLVTQIRALYPSFAYLHLTEPDLIENVAEDVGANDFLRKIWGDRPLINAAGYDRQRAIDRAEATPNSLVAFGRHFISNPDLPRRLKEDIPLNPYDRSTFYLYGSTTPRGYTDQPFADSQSVQKQQLVEGRL